LVRIERRGDVIGSIHARDELAEQGVEPVGEFEQNQFRELFYHPRNFGGAFVILAEYEAPHPAETASSTDEA